MVATRVLSDNVEFSVPSSAVTDGFGTLAVSGTRVAVGGSVAAMMAVLRSMVPVVGYRYH